MNGSHPLESLGPFQHLSDAGRQVLRRGVRHHAFARRATVLSRADTVAGAYIVVSGRLRVYTSSAAGREATLYEINPGETCVLALNCLFNDLRYPAWVDASPGTRVAIINGQSYRWLFEHEAAVRDMTIRALSTVVFRLMLALEDVQTRPLERRLAAFLVLHASSRGEVSMTQQSIGDHLGTTREVVARLLARLSRLDLLTRRRGRVV
ncbi:MAG TPA: Crp/Fnr family transcriptional regulator, partial [Vicinamibacterales bacterium]|nr:Crp/Fnr family transcriptional regulator [Vicinamibacterales bacterium]